MSLLSNVTLKLFVKNSLLSIDDLKQKYFQKWIYMTVSLVLFYFILGELIYTFWDDLDGLDALFLVVTTFSTVGYGAYAPSTSGVRLFTSAYILFGIGVGSVLIGALNDRYYNSTKTNKAHEAIDNRTVNQLSLLDSFRESLRLTSIRFDQYIFGGTSSAPITPKQALDESDSESDSHAVPEEKHENDKQHDINNHNHDQDVNEYDKSNSYSERQRQRFSLSRHSLPVNRALMDSQYSRMQAVYLQSYNEELKQLRVDTIYSFFILLFVLAIGSIFMTFMEPDWSFDIAIYFCVVTLSTVGYGDLVPTTVVTKVFTILYILIGCSFLARTITNIVRYPLILRDYKNEMRVLNQFGKYLSKERIGALADGDTFLKEFRNLQCKPGEVTKSEFCLSVLHLMSKVDRKHVAIISSIFDLLDVNGDGVLDNEKLEKLQEVAPTEDTILQMLEDEKWERINKKNPCFRALYTVAASTAAPTSSATSSQRTANQQPTTSNPQLNHSRDVEAYNLFLRATEKKPCMTEADATSTYLQSHNHNKNLNECTVNNQEEVSCTGIDNQRSRSKSSVEVLFGVFGGGGHIRGSSEGKVGELKTPLLKSPV